MSKLVQDNQLVSCPLRQADNRRPMIVALAAGDAPPAPIPHLDSMHGPRGERALKPLLLHQVLAVGFNLFDRLEFLPLVFLPYGVFGAVQFLFLCVSFSHNLSK